MEFIDALIPRVERFARFGNRLSGRVHDLNSFEAKRNIDSILSKTWAILVSAKKILLSNFFVNKMPIVFFPSVATWSSNIRRMNFSAMIFSIPFTSELFLDDQERLHRVFGEIC